jgi:predicted transcriptional regulator
MYQNGNFIKVDQTSNDNNNIYGLELDALLRLLFIEPVEYNDLINALTERLGKGTTTVKKIVKQWINDNLIYKSGNVYKRR